MAPPSYHFSVLRHHQSVISDLVQPITGADSQHRFFVTLVQERRG